MNNVFYEIRDLNTEEKLTNFIINSFKISFIVRFLFILYLNTINLSLFWRYIMIVVDDMIDYVIPLCLLLFKVYKEDKLSFEIFKELTKAGLLLNDKIKRFYRYNDKIMDVFSYSMFISYMKMNNYDTTIAIYLTLFRFVGSIFVIFFNNIYLLVLFPDLVKEIVGYNEFINPINKVSFIIITILKVIFEYVKLKNEENR